MAPQSRSWSLVQPGFKARRGSSRVRTLVSLCAMGRCSCGLCVVGLRASVCNARPGAGVQHPHVVKHVTMAEQTGCRRVWPSGKMGLDVVFERTLTQQGCEPAWCGSTRFRLGAGGPRQSSEQHWSPGEVCWGLQWCPAWRCSGLTELRGRYVSICHVISSCRLDIL